MSVGSASVVIAPLRSSASSVTLKFSPNARKVREMIPKLPTIEPSVTWLPIDSVGLSGLVIGVRLAPPPIAP